jgi:peptidoglycan/LPS O-acetylase OafA/YrhL
MNVPTARTPAAPHRLHFLDGLRGLAALGVALHHFVGAFYPSSTTADPSTVHLPSRWELAFATSHIYAFLTVRVCFFFVLSGFVLAIALKQAPRGWRALLVLLLRRYARLGVPVAGSVAIGYVLLLTHSFYNQPAMEISGGSWLHDYWRAMPTFRQYVGDSLYGVMLRGELVYNPVMWTMQIEWRGSMLVLALLALVPKRRWRLGLCIALALGLDAGQVSFYLVAMLLGLALHEVYCQAWVSQLARSERRALALALLAVALATTTHHLGPFVVEANGKPHLPGVAEGRVDDIYHTIEALCLLGAMLLSERARRWAAAPILRALGKRAFALYLVHFLVLGSAASRLFLWLHAHFAYNASVGLLLLATGLATWAATELFYRAIDKPSHALARWVGRVAAAVLALPRPVAPAS